MYNITDPIFFDHVAAKNMASSSFKIQGTK